MRAGSVIDREDLLDELELRLARCAVGVTGASSAIRIGGVLSAGELAHRVARNETRAFWNEHRLSEARTAVLADFLDGLLHRNPRHLAWALVPLLGELLPRFRSDHLIARIEAFVTSEEPVGRVVRDAVTVTLLVPWLSEQAEAAAVLHLVALCEASIPERIRMGCIGLGAYLEGRASIAEAVSRRAFDACLTVGTRVDPETSVAAGWALREVIKRDTRLESPFAKRVGELSRQAFRTAVERREPANRVRLTKLWNAGRTHRRKLDARTLPANTRNRSRIGKS
jgi:hypothetical protein